eukprot:17878_1
MPNQQFQKQTTVLKSTPVSSSTGQLQIKTQNMRITPTSSIIKQPPSNVSTSQLRHPTPSGSSQSSHTNSSNAQQKVSRVNSAPLNFTHSQTSKPMSQVSSTSSTFTPTGQSNPASNRQQPQFRSTGNLLPQANRTSGNSNQNFGTRSSSSLSRPSKIPKYHQTQQKTFQKPLTRQQIEQRQLAQRRQNVYPPPGQRTASRMPAAMGAIVKSTMPGGHPRMKTRLKRNKPQNNKMRAGPTYQAPIQSAQTPPKSAFQLSMGSSQPSQQSQGNLDDAAKKAKQMKEVLGKNTFVSERFYATRKSLGLCKREMNQLQSKLFEKEGEILILRARNVTVEKERDKYRNEAESHGKEVPLDDFSALQEQMKTLQLERDMTEHELKEKTSEQSVLHGKVKSQQSRIDELEKNLLDAQMTRPQDPPSGPKHLPPAPERSPPVTIRPSSHAASQPPFNTTNVAPPTSSHLLPLPKSLNGVASGRPPQHTLPAQHPQSYPTSQKLAPRPPISNLSRPASHQAMSQVSRQSVNGPPKNRLMDQQNNLLEQKDKQLPAASPPNASSSKLQPETMAPRSVSREESLSVTQRDASPSASNSKDVPLPKPSKEEAEPQVVRKPFCYSFENDIVPSTALLAPGGGLFRLVRALGSASPSQTPKTATPEASPPFAASSSSPPHLRPLPQSLARGLERVLSRVLSGGRSVTEVLPWLCKAMGSRNEKWSCSAAKVLHRLLLMSRECCETMLNSKSDDVDAPLTDFLRAFDLDLDPPD